MCIERWYLAWHCYQGAEEPVWNLVPPSPQQGWYTTSPPFTYLHQGAEDLETPTTYKKVICSLYPTQHPKRLVWMNWSFASNVWNGNYPFASNVRDHFGHFGENQLHMLFLRRTFNISCMVASTCFSIHTILINLACDRPQKRKRTRRPP